MPEIVVREGNYIYKLCQNLVEIFPTDDEERCLSIAQVQAKLYARGTKPSNRTFKFETRYENFLDFLAQRDWLVVEWNQQKNTWYVRRKLLNEKCRRPFWRSIREDLKAVRKLEKEREEEEAADFYETYSRGDSLAQAAVGGFNAPVGFGAVGNYASSNRNLYFLRTVL